eukprot:330282-Amphidinium_carterae.1
MLSLTSPAVQALPLATTCASTPQHLPTLQREQWKQRRQQQRLRGEQPSKRHFEVEAHYDDCVDSLQGLGPARHNFVFEGVLTTVESSPFLPTHFISAQPSSTPPTSILFDFCDVIYGQNIEARRRVRSSEISCLRQVGAVHPHLRSSSTWPKHPIILEICGGEARVSQILIAQARAIVGPNIDLINDYDLTRTELQQELLAYIERAAVPVVLMAHPCTALGPLGKLNRQTVKSWHLEGIN